MRGCRVWVIQNSRKAHFGNVAPCVFTPVLAKHSKSFSLIDCVSVGVDRMQRNFGPMQKQVEAWQRSELTDVTAKVVIYEAFVEGKLEAPNILPAPCTIFISSRSTRSSGREQFGVSRTPLRRHLKRLSRSHSLRRRRNWASFSRCDSPSSSNGGGLTGRHPFLKWYPRTYVGLVAGNRQAGP